MNKFWKYESGEAIIDEQCLYDSLFLEGYRYFKPPNDNHKFIVIFNDNKVNVNFLMELWRVCCWLIDKEFTSLSEEERTHVKKALKEIKKKLKKVTCLSLRSKI